MEKINDLQRRTHIAFSHFADGRVCLEELDVIERDADILWSSIPANSIQRKALLAYGVKLFLAREAVKDAANRLRVDKRKIFGVNREAEKSFGDNHQ